jgi:hypothetical protein
MKRGTYNIRNMHKILIIKSEGKRPLGNLQHTDPKALLKSI